MLLVDSLRKMEHPAQLPHVAERRAGFFALC